MPQIAVRLVGPDPVPDAITDLVGALGGRVANTDETAQLTVVLDGADDAGAAVDRAIEERSAVLCWPPMGRSDVAVAARRERAAARGVVLVRAAGDFAMDQQIADFVRGNAESRGNFYAHPTATIDAGAVIGAGTRIWHYAHISANSVIGERCSFGQNTFVAPSVRVGNNVKVQNNVSLYEGVICEDDVFLGPSCVLTNVFNPRSHVSRRHEYRTTMLRRGATVGANATVVCGAELGEYSFVGAGAVVTRDVPAFAQVVGSPARIVAWRCQCGERLAGATLPPGGSLACAACAARYGVSDAGELRWVRDNNEGGA